MNDNESKQRISIDALLAAAEHHAPPLDEDPSARLLGLVADTEDCVDGEALKAQRMKAGLTIADLAHRLSDAGWNVTTTDAFQWEKSGASRVLPALIVAIAGVIGVTSSTITAAKSAADRPAVVNSTQFKALATRWARLFRVSESSATEALVARLMVAVHRGDVQSTDQTLKTLEILVSDLESRDEP